MKMMDLVKKGMKPKMAIAKSLAMKRKMAKGGAVEGDYDLDGEHERGLFDLMRQGDQPPVANPEVMSEEMMLAKKLQDDEESREMMAMGGLVEGMSGDEEPDVHSGPMSSAPMSDENEPAEMGHAEIQGVPMSMALSEEAKKALMMKKKNRRFMK